MLKPKLIDVGRRMPVADAIVTGETRGRCVECGEPVRVVGPSQSGRNRAFVQHLRYNPRCSLSHRND